MTTHNVVVYSASWCPWCQKAKEFLTRNKVKFTEKDVDANPEYVAELQKKSKQTGIPVIEIDGNIIIGYDEATMRKLLGL
ncbi:glutaredoxin family protein [Candidatus Micrarchaeota archaeon]|nr:glutaredoxin family protein [Candidatus Micrarchaeota archaeon]